MFHSRRERAEQAVSPQQDQNTNSTTGDSSTPRMRESLGRNLEPVRMRSRSPANSRRDPNRRHGVYEDIVCPRIDLGLDMEESPMRSLRGRRRPRHRHNVEDMDIDLHLDMDFEEPDFCRDVERRMNEMRAEMNMSINLMRLPSSHHRIVLDIPRPNICRRRRLLDYKETAEERRIYEESNAGLIKGAEENDLPLVKRCVDRGAGIFHTNPKGWTALHIVASKGFTDLADFLISKGLYVDCRTPQGETPLMLAIRENDLTTVNCLLRNQASLRLTDTSGRPPLLHAAETCSKNILKTLIDRGAELNYTDKEGNSALILASMHKNNAAVEFLVSLSEIDVEKKCKTNNWTALHWAVSTESEENINTLVKAGAALNASCFNGGETPIRLANRLGNRNIKSLIHRLEAMSHRRVVYCSDGEELKYYLFVVAPPLEEDPQAPQSPTISFEAQHLLQAMVDALRPPEEAAVGRRQEELQPQEPMAPAPSEPVNAESPNTSETTQPLEKTAPSEDMMTKDAEDKVENDGESSITMLIVNRKNS